VPRQIRELSKSKIYHIMIRGNEKKNIFLDNEDREKFTSILCDKNDENRWFLYAFCLMDNHVHLLINEGDENISRIMKRISTSYVYYFNKKYKRVGHLLQDRYRSEAIENDRYLLAAARYIHNNPVKVGMAKEPSQYEWSSYKLYLDKNGFNNRGIERNTILEMFSVNEDKAIRLFIEYSDQATDDRFIDYKEEVETEINEENVVIFVKSFLYKNGRTMESLKRRENVIIRNNLIIDLKKKSNLSIRKIASLLGINKEIVHRVK